MIDLKRAWTVRSMPERASWFELKQRLGMRSEETPRSRKTKRGQTFGKEESEKGSACEVLVSHVACSGGIADSETPVGPLRPEGSTGIIKRSLAKAVRPEASALVYLAAVLARRAVLSSIVWRQPDEGGRPGGGGDRAGCWQRNLRRARARLYRSAVTSLSEICRSQVVRVQRSVVR